jgi:hypothetical protein
MKDVQIRKSIDDPTLLCETASKKGVEFRGAWSFIDDAGYDKLSNCIGPPLQGGPACPTLSIEASGRIGK